MNGHREGGRVSEFQRSTAQDQRLHMRKNRHSADRSLGATRAQTHGLADAANTSQRHAGLVASRGPSCAGYAESRRRAEAGGLKERDRSNHSANFGAENG